MIKLEKPRKARPRATPKSNIPVILEVLRLIDESGIALEDLGRISGVHFNSIGYWRRGQVGGTVENLRAIANALGYELTLVKKETK